MKFVLSVLVALFTLSTVKAQQGMVDLKTGDSIMKAQATRLPKCYKAYCDISKDTLLKSYNFMRREKAGPASSTPMGGINLNLSFFEQPKPDFDDNRLLIVLYHELGHLYYARQTPAEQRDRATNEKFAFEYSLKRAKEMADNGDCLPLKTGLKFMHQRSQSDNMVDEHVRALKILVKDPYFIGLQEFANNCK